MAVYKVKNKQVTQVAGNGAGGSSGGGSVVVDEELNRESSNPVQNKVLYNPVTFAETERLKTLNKFSSDIVQGAWFFATGEYGTATEYICNKFKIPINPNTMYTVSFESSNSSISFAGLIFFNSEGTMVSSLSLESNPMQLFSFTSPSNAYYVSVTVWKGSYTATIYPNEITNVLLNEGYDKIQYQPYYGDIVHKKEIYPVGAIYTSVESTSPASLFGGIWEQLKDTFLLAHGNTYTSEKSKTQSTAEAGSADAVVVSHTHGFLSGGVALTMYSSGAETTGGFANGSYWGGVNKQTSGIAGNGESGTGKNMPPYLTVYMWKRVG